MSLLFESIEPIYQLVQRINRRDEDSIDRLNHKYSFLLFMVLAVVVTINQYAGEIIKCWSPAQYPESWVEYAHSVCWISNTYYVPMEETNILAAHKVEVIYYQWVPLVLMLQALLFYVPGVFWFMYNRSTGFDINKIVSVMRQMESINPDNRDKTTKFLVKHIDRSIKCTKHLPKGRFQGIKRAFYKLGFVLGKKYGNYLISAYFFTKILYIGNVIFQLWMLNLFLGTEYSFYGFEVLRDLGREGAYKESIKFPRVTLCDFRVRQIARIHTVTVQCTLPINLFHEKLFTFVWFWLVLLLFVNSLTSIMWLSALFPQTRVAYIKKYLKVFDKYKTAEDKYTLIAFCDKYLRLDGYFALRMIAKNTNEVVIGELISSLWDHFRRHNDVGKYQKSSGTITPVV